MAANFNGQQAQELGPLSNEAQRGMYVQPIYAVTTAREPPGIRMDMDARAAQQRRPARRAEGKPALATTGWPNWR